jgi:hypothetical protein
MDAKPPVMILSYADNQSTGGDCLIDYNIGSDSGLIGSNKSLGAESKYVFTLLKKNGRDYVGYCGKSGERVMDQQPWAANWKYIYKSECHAPIEYLEVYAERYGVDPKIFIRSKQFGHPNKNDYEQFWKVIKAITN